MKALAVVYIVSMYIRRRRRLDIHVPVPNYDPGSSSSIRDASYNTKTKYVKHAMITIIIMALKTVLGTKKHK